MTNFKIILAITMLLFLAMLAVGFYPAITFIQHKLPPSINDLLAILEKAVAQKDEQLYTVCINKLDNNDDPQKPGYVLFIGNTTVLASLKGTIGNPSRVTSSTIINRYEDECYSRGKNEKNTALMEAYCENEYTKASMQYDCVDGQGNGACVAVEGGPDYCENPKKVQRMKRYSWH